METPSKTDLAYKNLIDYYMIIDSSDLDPFVIELLNNQTFPNPIVIGSYTYRATTEFHSMSRVLFFLSVKENSENDDKYQIMFGMSGSINEQMYEFDE